MDPELNAIGYSYNSTNYKAEFQRVLCGILSCYTMMLKDRIVIPNDENKIRDCLLRYLNDNNNRVKLHLTTFLFDKEVPEDNNLGRLDIKVQTLKTFERTEAYYIIECKRLDNRNTNGITGLNAQYIKNGISRFVSKKYSSYYKINGMIGFVVEEMNIHSNIEHINNLLENHFTFCNTIIPIKKQTFIPDFEYHYSSEHKNIDEEVFTLYHLMFDVSILIEQ